MAVQLETYSPIGSSIVSQQPLRQAVGFISWWDKMMSAARIKYGHAIQLQSPAGVRSALSKFVEDLAFTVVHSDPEPVMTRPTVIDVTFKEFTNKGEKEDETVFYLGKNLPIAAGLRYKFTMTEGIKFDHKLNLGAQIVGLAMASGYMRVGLDHSKMDRTYNNGVRFNYHHKEKISIPPKTKVKARIVTSTRKYWQNYTLEFSTPRSSVICFTFHTGPGEDCNVCGLCPPKEGYLYAPDIMQNLPNYRDGDDGYCSFTQSGTLSWIGEAFTVEKTEEPAQ